MAENKRTRFHTPTSRLYIYNFFLFQNAKNVECHTNTIKNIKKMSLSRFGEATVPAGPHQTVTTYDNINRHTTARSVGPAHVKQRKRNGAKTKINCQHIYTQTHKQTKKEFLVQDVHKSTERKKKSLVAAFL